MLTPAPSQGSLPVADPAGACQQGHSATVPLDHSGQPWAGGAGPWSPPVGGVWLQRDPSLVSSAPRCPLLCRLRSGPGGTGPPLSSPPSGCPRRSQGLVSLPRLLPTGSLPRPHVTSQGTLTSCLPWGSRPLPNTSNTSAPPEEQERPGAPTRHRCVCLQLKPSGQCQGRVPGEAPHSSIQG